MQKSSKYDPGSLYVILKSLGKKNVVAFYSYSFNIMPSPTS